MTAWATLAAVSPETAHAAFDDAARALFEQGLLVNKNVVRRAYQLLLEMHARHAPIPEFLELPILVWELRSEERTLSAAVTVTPEHWEFNLNGADSAERRIAETGQQTSTPREMASFIMHAFMEGPDRSLADADTDPPGAWKDS